MNDQDAISQAIAALEQLEPDIDWEQTPGSGDSDLCGRLVDGRTLVVEAKRLSTVRFADLEGRLAHNILSLRGREEAGQRVGVVSVPKLSHKAEKVANEFMKRFAPQMGWIIVDDLGAATGHIPRLGNIAVDGMHDILRKPSRRIALFSDLNRWLLKILLYAQAPTEYWNGPRGPFSSPAQLGHVAKVSSATVHRFADVGKQSGFLSTSGGLHLRDHERLLKQWLAIETSGSSVETYVRNIFREPIHLEGLATTQRFGIAGFEAARRQRLAHTSSERVDIYVESLEMALNDWDLDICDPRDAQMVIRVPKHPESVFRAVRTAGQASVVDPFQSSLDIAGLGGRSREQADYIRDWILSWVTS